MAARITIAPATNATIVHTVAVFVMALLRAPSRTTAYRPPVCIAGLGATHVPVAFFFNSNVNAADLGYDPRSRASSRVGRLVAEAQGAPPRVSHVEPRPRSARRCLHPGGSRCSAPRSAEPVRT